MSRKEVRVLQHELNRWTKKYLRGVALLRADGKKGPTTNRRIKWVKWYCGYGKNAGDNSAEVTSRFMRSLRHPHSLKWNTREVLRAAFKRRTRQRTRARVATVRSVGTRGVTRYDGVPVAKWMVPFLKTARARGWRGRLVSGWRSPAYSDSLCRRMCGAPRCPGRCAGRASNHAGSVYPNGAVDVSDYYRFGRVVQRPLHNSLGARDPVHFSQSGN